MTTATTPSRRGRRRATDPARPPSPPNILTFNPGLVLGPDQPDTFTDVRQIQEALEEAGLELQERVGADNPSGPAHITLVDPDGNPILIDQHR